MQQEMNPNPEQGVNPLEKYGINLTELSKEGKIDPVIGREDEIRVPVAIRVDAPGGEDQLIPPGVSTVRTGSAASKCSPAASL